MKQKFALEATLLIVDDEKEILETLQTIVNPHFGKVLIADSAEQALFTLRRHAVNIMLIDQKMPNMTGLELMKEVKKIYPLMPFVMLTGHTSDPAVKEAMNQGVFDVLGKPFNEQILINRLINALILPKMVKILWASLTDYLPVEDLKELESASLEHQLDVLYSYSGLLQTKRMKKQVM